MKYFFKKIQNISFVHSESNDNLYYTKVPCKLQQHTEKEGFINQKMIGMTDDTKIFSLKDGKENNIPLPLPGQMVISQFLSDVYGIKKGAHLNVKLGKNTMQLEVTVIADNAEKEYIYMNREQLNELN